MNDFGYDELAYPNRLLNWYWCMKEIIKNTFYDIYNTLAKDLTTSHSLSQSPLVPRADNNILTI